MALEFTPQHKIQAIYLSSIFTVENLTECKGNKRDSERRAAKVVQDCSRNDNQGTRFYKGDKLIDFGGKIVQE